MAASGAPSVFCSIGAAAAGTLMGDVEAGFALFAGASPFIWFIMRWKSSAESVFLIAMPESSPGVASCAIGMCVAADMGTAGIETVGMVSRETSPI